MRELIPLHCCQPYCRAVIAWIENTQGMELPSRVYCGRCLNDMKMLLDYLGAGNTKRPAWYWETGGYKYRRIDRMYGSPELSLNAARSIGDIVNDYMQTMKLL